jgi:peptide subunit release factor RF-3
MAQGTSSAIIFHVGRTGLLDIHLFAQDLSKKRLERLEPYVKDEKRALDWLKRETDRGIGIAPAEIQQKDDQERDNLIQILRAHEQKDQCEALYAEGRIIDAAVSLLEIGNTVNNYVRANMLIMDWLSGKFLC